MVEGPVSWNHMSDKCFRAFVSGSCFSCLSIAVVNCWFMVYGLHVIAVWTVV